jgi:hypothetical protein
MPPFFALALTPQAHPHHNVTPGCHFLCQAAQGPPEPHYPEPGSPLCADACLSLPAPALRGCAPVNTSPLL